MTKFPVKLAGAVAASFLGIILLAAGSTTIETGNVGVVRTFSGKILDEELRPGWHYVLFDSVSEWSAKEITIVLDNLKPKASDNLTLDDLDAAVVYQVNPAKMSDINSEFKKVTVQDDDGVWLPAHDMVKIALEEATLSAVSKYDSLTAHTKRADIAATIKVLAQQKLDSRMPNTFYIKNVSITSLNTDKSIEASIRAKATALNDLQAMSARLEKAKKDAELNKALNTTYTEEYLQHEKNVALQKCAEHQGCTMVIVDSNFKGNVNLKP